MSTAIRGRKNWWEHFETRLEDKRLVQSGDFRHFPNFRAWEFSFPSKHEEAGQLQPVRFGLVYRLQLFRFRFDGYRIGILSLTTGAHDSPGHGLGYIADIYFYRVKTGADGRIERVSGSPPWQAILKEALRAGFTEIGFYRNEKRVDSFHLGCCGDQYGRGNGIRMWEARPNPDPEGTRWVYGPVIDNGPIYEYPMRPRDNEPVVSAKMRAWAGL